MDLKATSTPSVIHRQGQEVADIDVAHSNLSTTQGTSPWRDSAGGRRIHHTALVHMRKQEQEANEGDGTKKGDVPGSPQRIDRKSDQDQSTCCLTLNSLRRLERGSNNTYALLRLSRNDV